MVTKCAGSFLVFATTSYPGWTATVDGEEAPVWNTDAALMGVVVPEGTHQIAFTFTDPGFHSGLQATLAGAVLLLALLFLTRRAKDAGSASTPPSEGETLS